MVKRRHPDRQRTKWCNEDTRTYRGIDGAKKIPGQTEDQMVNRRRKVRQRTRWRAMAAITTMLRETSVAFRKKLLFVCIGILIVDVAVIGR